MNAGFTVVFEECEEGGYLAYLEALPGVNTQGEPLEDAKLNLEEAFRLIVETENTLKSN